MRKGLLSIALLSAAIATPARGQTLDEVQQAVDGCVGLGEQPQAARAKLTGWGNKALPYLRDIAGNPRMQRCSTGCHPWGTAA
jgi:hypothetical protein